MPEQLRLSDELRAIDKRNNAAWLGVVYPDTYMATNPLFVMMVTTRLLDGACWQGLREDRVCFHTLEDAKRYKEIVKAMIGVQTRKKNTASLGEEEIDYLGSHNFSMFWDVGAIIKVERSVVL